jgi:hypothetical protein
MYDLTLTKVSENVARGDRAAALRILRAAVASGEMVPRDGIELMLTIRQGSADNVNEAIELLRSGLSGAYRFIPKADHAFA